MRAALTNRDSKEDYNFVHFFIIILINLANSVSLLMHSKQTVFSILTYEAMLRITQMYCSE
jgi:hypothetical protein